MARRLRKPLLAIVPIALVVVLVIVLLSGASPRRVAGPGCNNPADSALNQYCDAVPADTGLQTPQPGQAGLALRLPAGLRNRIEHHSGLAGTSASALLTLPAAGPRHSLRRTTETAGIGTLSGAMIGVLAALAALLLGVASVSRWRRRRTG